MKIENVLSLISGEITKEQFLEIEQLTIAALENLLLKYFLESIEKKDPEDTFFSICIMINYDICDDRYLDRLNYLLECDWFDENAYIVEILSKYKSTRSINYLYNVIMEFNDNFYNITSIWSKEYVIEAAIKTIGEIATDEATNKLKMLKNIEFKKNNDTLHTMINAYIEK